MTRTIQLYLYGYFKIEGMSRPHHVVDNLITAELNPNLFSAGLEQNLQLPVNMIQTKHKTYYHGRILHLSLW